MRGPNGLITRPPLTETIHQVKTRRKMESVIVLGARRSLFNTHPIPLKHCVSFPLSYTLSTPVSLSSSCLGLRRVRIRRAPALHPSDRTPSSGVHVREANARLEPRRMKRISWCSPSLSRHQRKTGRGSRVRTPSQNGEHLEPKILWDLF